MDSLSLHRGGWRDARVVLQALFAQLAVYLNRAGGWAAQAPTTDLRTPPPTSRSPTRTNQPICRCNNIPRHFLRPTMIEFALLFTCFRKLGPGFRKPSAGPVDLPPYSWRLPASYPVQQAPDSVCVSMGPGLSRALLYDFYCRFIFTVSLQEIHHFTA